MAEITLNVIDKFVTVTCYSCGARWAMLADFNQNRLNDHKQFYCPNGHSQHYTGESEAEKLRRELQRSQQQIARAEDERNDALRREAAAKREAARVRKRIGSGVCPCCNRTFSQLARHMQNKHPDVPFVPTVKADPRKRVRA